MSRFLGWKTPTSAHEYNISTLWKDRYHDQANKPTARNCTTEGRKIWWFLFGRLFGWPGSYDLLLNEYLKTQSWSGEWILDEERGARHCEDALSGLPSQHKRLCTQRSPKMTSFQEEGGYLSLFMEKETSVLCSSNNLATSPPSVKSSRNPPLSLYPPIIPSSTSSTTPHPNPSIPLVTSSRPDRHQRAGNIGILCHRFCSYRFRGKWTIEHEIRCVDILSLWHST